MTVGSQSIIRSGLNSFLEDNNLPDDDYLIGLFYCFVAIKEALNTKSPTEGIAETGFIVRFFGPAFDKVIYSMYQKIFLDWELRKPSCYTKALWPYDKSPT